mgnify:CR=1 FL=1
MKRALLLFMIVVSCVSQELCAQKVGVKTNLTADFALNPNIGLEVGLAPKWTLEVDGLVNAWADALKRQTLEALGSAARSQVLAM